MVNGRVIPCVNEALKYKTLGTFTICMLAKLACQGREATATNTDQAKCLELE